MMKDLKILMAVLVCAVSAYSCTESSIDDIDFADRRTLILYSAGFNNLSNALLDDIEDICESYVPDGNRRNRDNLFIFSHHIESGYKDRTSPHLIKVYRVGDKIFRDTLVTYPPETSAVSPETLRNVLKYVDDNFKSEEYGLIFSSHASGWLPPNFSLNGTWTASESSASSPQRSIGQDAGTLEEMDAKDFAAALPMKFKYIIFDSCLVGGIEVAYEFKDVTDYLVFSAEEILSDGLVYTDITRRLLQETPSDIIGVAEDFYKHYDSLSGIYRSATISVVDCSQLDGLASVCAEIFSSHKGQIPAINYWDVQPMRRSFQWFYDFRDILDQLGLSESETVKLDEALERCILYKANTEYFFETELETFCGISMYLPSAVKSSAARDYLNEYYRGFKWDKATGYLDAYFL